MTYEEALRLVRLPKWVVDENGNKVETLTLEQKYPMQFRLHLLSEADYSREYMLDVKQSAKLGIRLNFQLMGELGARQIRLSGDEAPNETDPSIYTNGIVTVGEHTIVPDGISVGKNSVISGNLVKNDFENNALGSGKTLIKAGDEL